MSRSRSSARRRSATRVSCFDFTASVASNSSSRRRASAASPARSRSASSLRRRRSRSLRASASSDRSDLMRRMVRSPSRCSARGSGRDARIAATCKRGSCVPVVMFGTVVSPSLVAPKDEPFCEPTRRDRFFSNASKPRRASSPSSSSLASFPTRAFSFSAISISISRRSASARARRISACVAYSDAVRTARASRVALNAFTESILRSICTFDRPKRRDNTASSASCFCLSPSWMKARRRAVSIKALLLVSRARTTSPKILASASRRVWSFELNAPTPRWDSVMESVGLDGKDALRASAETSRLLLCSTSRTIASSTLFSCTSRRLAAPRSSRTTEVTARASRGMPSFCRDG